MIVDAVFTIILALMSNGNLDTAALTFPNKAACVAYRSERIDYVNSKTEKEKQGLGFYISECTAVPVVAVTQ